VIVDFPWRADLLDAGVVHDDDAIGHFQGFLLVVGDEDARDVQLLMQLPQPAPQFEAHFGIERPERLVEQQHLRLDGECPGQRDALPLTAAELAGIADSRAPPTARA
jgi:hypothetical protein